MENLLNGSQAKTVAPKTYRELQQALKVLKNEGKTTIRRSYSMSEYGKSIKFHLVDIKNIESEVARLNFDEHELEELAELILVTGCLLQPLILRQIDPINYKVLEGHFEYHAAVYANKKDTKRSLGGMVSAFVIKQEIEATVIEQVRILNKVVSTSQSG